MIERLSLVVLFALATTAFLALTAFGYHAISTRPFDIVDSVLYAVVTIFGVFGTAVSVWYLAIFAIDP